MDNVGLLNGGLKDESRYAAMGFGRPKTLRSRARRGARFEIQVPQGGFRVKEGSGGAHADA
jgi:hypothetical protein